MKRILITCIIIILIPFFITKNFKKVEQIQYTYVSNQIIKVKNENTGKITEVPFEKYIIGVVSGEMPCSFEKEALKAQAVASRSYALYHMNGKEYDVTNTTTNQVYLTDDELKTKWQNKYEENYKIIKKAVIQTKGEYLTYNGEIVNAMFFSTSTGKTENSEEVFVSKVPYLRSVESSWDESSPAYTDIQKINISDFYEKLNLPYNEKLKIEITERTSTGRVKMLKINNQEMKGRDVATKLNLRSNYFEMFKNENTITITTKGYGHGVGMSQYGANGMAKEGYNYKEILKHYYLGTEIKKL